MKNKFIKHDKNMDICFEVVGSDDFDLYTYIWNMGQTSAYEVGQVLKIPINKIYEDGWYYCENSKEILDNNKSFKEGVWKSLKM